MSLPPAEEAVAAAFHALRAKKKRDNPVARAILERIERAKIERLKDADRCRQGQ